MARVSNIFTDPKTGVTYSWPVNHSEEQPMAKGRQMGDGAPTSNLSLIPQQGPATPLLLSWKGSIFTLAQFQQMLVWWQLCETQTIYITDFQGNKFEVIITDFAPQRMPVAQNRHDPVNAPTWIWQYTLTMRVVTVISGDWLGVTP